MQGSANERVPNVAKGNDLEHLRQHIELFTSFTRITSPMTLLVVNKRVDMSRCRGNHLSCYDLTTKVFVVVWGD